MSCHFFFVEKYDPNFLLVEKSSSKKPKKIVDSNEERNGFGEGRGTLRTWTVRPGKWSLDSQGSNWGWFVILKKLSG